MKILVYVDRYRDRDLWPMVDQLCEAHDVYYAFARATPVGDIISQDARTPFDMVITADRVMNAHGPRLFPELTHRPRVFEVIFNDLDELASTYDASSLDERLIAQNSWLLVLNGALHDAWRALGHTQVRHLPLGVSSRSIGGGEYYRTRWGRRRMGWQPQRRRRDALLGTARQLASGFIARPRTTDIAFLGECGYGLDAAALHDLAQLADGMIPSQEVQAIATGFDSMFAGMMGASAAEVEHVLDSTFLDRFRQHALTTDQRHSFAIVRARLLAQFRSFRRFELVRRLGDHFGPRFHLIGDHFRRYGLRAQPTDFRNEERIYWRSKIAVDFGSNSFDCSIHPRVARIIRCGACVLQREQADAVEMWSTSASARTFTDSSSMIARVEQVLENRAERDELIAKQRLLATTTADWSKSIHVLFD